MQDKKVFYCDYIEEETNPDNPFSIASKTVKNMKITESGNCINFECHAGNYIPVILTLSKATVKALSLMATENAPLLFLRNNSVYELLYTGKIPNIGLFGTTFAIKYGNRSHVIEIPSPIFDGEFHYDWETINIYDANTGELITDKSFISIITGKTI